MSGSHLDHHIAHGIKELVSHLPPLRTRKNPVIAGLLGFLFGGVGLGLYLGTWSDFFVPILVFMGLSFIFPVLGTLAAIAFATGWGVVRAINSGG